MGFSTSQQLNKFYDTYQNISITFTKDVIQALTFNPQQAYIRCVGGQWPCIINSASMTSAKIIAGKKSGLYEKLNEGIISVNIHFDFFNPESKDSLAFFVTAKVLDITNYTNSEDLVIINLEYTQRAPDALIEKIGLFLEASLNSKNRRYERINLDPLTIRKINLTQTETLVAVDGIPRRAIMLNLSFSGVKFIMIGVANFLLNKEATIKIHFEEPSMTIQINGKLIRADPVEGRKDLVAVAMQYHDESIPSIYKIHLNNFFTQQRKSMGESDEAFFTNPDVGSELGSPIKDFPL